MSPERRAQREGAASGALLGAVGGVVAFAGGSALLVIAPATAAALAGVAGTAVAALAAGVWAGSPPHAAEAESRSRLTARWIGAGVAVGVAGLFALLWAVLGPRLGGWGRLPGPLLLLAAPLYAIGLVFPALVRSVEETHDDPDEGRPSIGAPTLAAALAGFAAGTVLAGVFLLPRFAAGPLLFAAAAVLTWPLLWPRRASPRSVHELVWEEETPFGMLHVVDTVFPGERQPERRLYLNDEVESGELVRGGAPTLAYVAAAERWLAEITPRGGRYLLLGGGAYTLPRRLAERDPAARITVGELDPEVTRVAQRFFGLRPEHGIRALHGDARALLNGAEPGSYDRIYLDVYDGREAVPYPLLTREAWLAAGRALRPGGVVALNLIGVASGEGARRFWSAVRTATDALPSVALYHHLGPDFPDPQNFLLAAAPDPAFVFPDRAGPFERWAPSSWPEWGATLVFRDRFPDGAAAG